MPSRLFPTVGAVGLALLCTLAVSGCAITKDDSSSPDAARSTPSPSRPTATVTVTESPTETASPTATPTTTSGPPPTASATATGPEGALLSATELPPVNESSPWTQRSTGSAPATGFGLCQKFDLSSIGAETTVQRTFVAGEDTAAQQVAVLPDAQNTVRASRVIASWHDDCRGRVAGRRVNVRPFADVAVAQGKGSWYLVSYVRGGQGHFHSLGMAFNGRRLTLLRMDHLGQDHNYDPGQDPMERAVKAAAAKLGR